MIRRFSWNVLILSAALALVAGSSAFAQTKEHPRRARTAPSARPASAQQAANLGFGVAESLSGTIQMVVVDQNLLVVKGPNNVPYDLKITPKTVIIVGVTGGTIETLASHIGSQVSVGFVPQRDGNFATRVEVSD